MGQKGKEKVFGRKKVVIYKNRAEAVTVKVMGEFLEYACRDTESGYTETIRFQMNLLHSNLVFVSPKSKKTEAGLDTFGLCLS